MPDRRYVYRVELAQGSAANSARQLKQIFQRELSSLQVNPRVSTGGGIAPAAGSFRAGGELLPGFGNLTGLLGTTVAGVGIGAAVAQMGRMALELDRQATSYRRINVAAVELAGSQEKLNNLMEGYRQVTGGAIDRATALADVTRLQALGFADTRAEMERFMVAVRGASLATGSDPAYISQQLQLAISNMSTMRLDQLGVGVGELRARMEELKGTLAGASEEMIYQESLLSLLEQKYGALVRSAEAAATGQELLRVAIQDMRLGASTEGGRLGDALRELDDAQVRLAVIWGGATAPAAQLVDLLEKMNEVAQDQGATPWWARPFVGDATERQIEGTQALLDLWGRLNKATQDGARIMPGYEQAVVAAMQAAVDKGFITVEIMEQILTLLSQFDAMVGNFDVRQFGPPTREQFEATRPQKEPVPPGWGMFSTIGQGIATGDFTNVRRTLQIIGNENRAQAARDADATALRAARAAETAWEKAAKETEEEFRRVAQAFKSDLEGIPGLFGTSPVTEDQLSLAGLGVPQNFADNYLRRLTDEVLNGVDWQGVDIADAARRAGIDEALDPKAILQLFTQAWQDSSLFANPANLDLIDREAVQAGLRRAADARRGRENLLAMFGLTPDGEYREAEEMGRVLGIRVAEGTVKAIPETSPQITAAVQAGLTSDAAVKQYADAGRTMALEVNAAFNDAALGLDWHSAILSSLMEGIRSELELAPAQ